MTFHFFRKTKALVVRTSFLSGLFATALSISWTASAHAEQKPILLDSVLAVVNHHVITKSQIDRSLAPTFKKLHAQYRGSAYRELVTSLEYKLMMKKINEQLEMEEADRTGLTLSDEELDRTIDSIMQKNNFTARWQLKQALSEQGMNYHQYREQLRKQMTILKLINTEVRSTVVISQDEVRQYYLDHREQFRLPPHVTLADIFLKTPPGATPAQVAAVREKGNHILRQISRKDDFAILAGSESEGPNSDNGGNLGDLTKDQLLPELIGPAFSVPVGGTSGLIQTDRGFYIIKVLKRESHPYQRFRDIKARIQNDLSKKTTRKRLLTWLEQLRGKSYVVIYMTPPPDEKA